MEKNKLRISKKMRAIIVIAFIAIYALGTYVSLRGQYLEYVELGEQYVEKFFTDIKYKYSIMGITFVLLSIILYFTNRGIKKGLKPFFEQEKREVPKLPNKSITLIVAAIASVIVSNDLVDKVLLFVSNASFGKTDIIFNFYFKAVDRELLRKSKLIKKLLRNAIIVSIGMALQNALNTQNIVTGKFLTLSNGTELTGAGVIESTIQLWGYLILSVIIVIAVIISVKFFAQNKMKKIVYPVAVVPIYLVTLFLVMVGYDFIFVKSNEFDKERKYISENIKSTQEAYNIKVKETSIEYSGTIKEDEVEKNDDVIDNITIVNKELVKKSLKDTQTETGYYIYNSVSLAKYNINGKDQLTYVAPREAENNTISYNNKTYEYTHGMGQIIASATSVTEDGNVEYLQKDISGSDNMLEVKEPRIYYGVETNSVAVTNTKNKSEYDYTDSDGVEHVNNYDGNSGIQVGFWDRLILAVKNKDIRLAMTSSISSESKILTNRNIVKRAKAVLPNLIYDENPYTVVDDGKIYWVLDAYTVSDKYPYSTYTEVEYDGAKRNINYIRNSVKVIINAYDGEMTFYITDRNDPVIMAYLKLYPTIFSDYTGKEIPDGIKQQMKYPKFLYDVQSEMLMVYHNVKEDVLYRNNDIWALTKYGTTSTKSKVATLEPYYAMIKTPDNDKSELGLIQMYTQNGKSNITSYLVGSCNGTECELKIYKYPTDSNILGPIQLDNQIDQDETISTELSTIDVTGSKISKDMKIIPINNTVLYVETIYQTMTNEPNQPTTLKKVIVASGTKVAIGNTLEEAISNLLSQSAVNIEITNTEDVDGMIQAIINANKNLTESNDRNDWEMMGSDLKELQSLIDSLDKMIKENNKKTQ